MLLKAQGYKNIFVHSGLLDFDNLKSMLVHEQFDVIIGKEQMKGCGGPERTWGYDDEFMFKRAHQEFVKCSDRPFFGYIFKVSNHAPYDLPDRSHYIFGPGDHEEYRFLLPIVYDYRAADFATNVSELDPTLGRAIREKANAVYQFSSDLLAADRIFPGSLVRRSSSN